MNSAEGERAFDGAEHVILQRFHAFVGKGRPRDHMQRNQMFLARICIAGTGSGVPLCQQSIALFGIGAGRRIA